MSETNCNLKLLLAIALVWLALLALLFVLMASAVQGFTYSINSTLESSNESVNLTVLGYKYLINLTFFDSAQQTDVEIDSVRETVYQNQTNATLVCDVPTEVNLSEETVENIDETIGLQLKSQFDTRTAEIINRVTEDIQFQIKPSQAKFDVLEQQLLGCKQNVTNAQKSEMYAQLQQEKWFFENERCQEDNTVWMYISLGLFFIIIIVIVVISGGGKLPFTSKIKFW